MLIDERMFPRDVNNHVGNLRKALVNTLQIANHSENSMALLEETLECTKKIIVEIKKEQKLRAKKIAQKAAEKIKAENERKEIQRLAEAKAEADSKILPRDRK